MPSQFLGLNTGLSGLNYYQASLNTTGHNISNADTKGYTRQVVQSQASQAVRVRTAYGMQGTGVTMTGIEQQRNLYYDTKYRSATSKDAEYTAIKEQLTQVESYLNEMKSESGYTKLLSKVSDSLHDLETSPSDATYRTQYIQTVDSFATLIREAATNYQNAQRDINNEIAVHVDEINSISRQIYTLNQQIINIETRGGNANDLRDQRELLVDNLSKIVDVSVTETPIVYGTGEDAHDSGAKRYEVRIAGQLLVDEVESKQLKVVARQEKINQNDIDGLYDIYWVGLNDSLGDKLDLNRLSVTGMLKGLLEVRDGNNANPVSGTILAMNENTADGSTAKIELDSAVSVDKLNLPDRGIVTLNCKEYYYEGFEGEYDADGKIINITFKNLTLQEESGKRVPAKFDASLDVGKAASVGESIDCKGIPYYMTQLNEFVRTFSKYMNDIITKGADANGDKGLDMFTMQDTIGNDYILTDNPNTDTTKLVSSNQTYYRMTALTFSVNQSVLADQDKLVVSYKEDIEQGNKEAKGVLDEVLYGLTNQNMFSQGTIAQFLQSVTTSQAVDITKYTAFGKNMNEVANVINNQRKSVSSVDTNEEAANLSIYQQGYNLSSKVISVLNEVYNKLINETG